MWNVIQSLTSAEANFTDWVTLCLLFLTLLLLKCFLFSSHSKSPSSLLTMAALDHSVSSLKYFHSAEEVKTRLEYLPHLLLPSPWPVSVWVPILQFPLHHLPGQAYPSPWRAGLCPYPSYVLGVSPTLLSVTLSSSLCPVLHSSCCLHMYPLVCTDVAGASHPLTPLPIVTALKEWLALFVADLI